MMLFKPYHEPLILAKKKTETRRIWPHGCRAKEGSIHQAKTEMFGEAFADILILKVWRQRLGTMTEKDAKAEGGYTLQEYKKTWEEINRRPWDPSLEVWAVRFKLESGVCQRCEVEGQRFWLYPYTDEDTGQREEKAVCWDCTFDLMNGRGDMGDDAAEIQMERAEEDYECDPLYYPPPPWLLR